MYFTYVAYYYGLCNISLGENKRELILELPCKHTNGHDEEWDYNQAICRECNESFDIYRNTSEF